MREFNQKEQQYLYFSKRNRKVEFAHLCPMARSPQSYLLKAALFATGLAGIVAEYILATLATYFLGDSVFQWTIVLSLMLFAMGIGSRISRLFDKRLLEALIVIEFLLSVLTSGCVLAVYGLAAYIDYLDLLIYGFCLLIGLLIGMEIPLVTRINGHYESLRSNIAGVMENDYYGSLLGGLFFAFVGLPFLGLTYTPFILGGINFLVALALFAQMRPLIVPKAKLPLVGAAMAVVVTLGAGLFFSRPIVLFGEQSRYEDKVVFTKQTRYQHITLTQWQDDYWLFLNNSKQLSTFDEWLYHEPLVHPAMAIHPDPKRVLVLGGGDGCAIREALKYSSVDSIIQLELDPEMTAIGTDHPVFRKMNKDAYRNPKVRVINRDAFDYLAKQSDYFDVIIADFPDPKSIEVNRLYTLEFYRLCYRHLRDRGIIITQAGSPYHTSKAFQCVQATMREAGFGTLPLHNHVITLGQWGFVLGGKNIESSQLKPAVLNARLEGIPTRWLTPEAMYHITSFGKPLFPIDSVEVNALHNQVLYRYYGEGNWEI